ncbi:hypothetical protein LTS08_007954 [Lithohypha guttulata]|nr:hypothetical protein LTS08_007954 [Lithohypha guttulata]
MSSTSSPPPDPSVPIPRDSDTAPPQPSDQQDERRPRRPRRREDFPESQASKMWRAFENPEGGPVNELPGGKFNSAGGKPREASWRDAFRFDQFFRSDRPAFYKTGCARDSLLVGIGTGGAVGGINFILRGLRGMMTTGHYAVGVFTLTAGGMYAWCTSRQREEAKGIAMAVAGMRMLHEKKAKEEAEKKRLLEEERLRKLQEEEEQRRNKRWYKWW